jgi:transcriptional regulator with XRE-family HTH domain
MYVSPEWAAIEIVYLGEKAMAGTQLSASDVSVSSSDEQLRVTALQKLAAALRSLPFEAERSDFSRLFAHAQLVLEVDDLELARTLRVSRPTVGRWTRGDSAPHPIGRQPVLMTLAKLAEAKLRVHANHREAVAAY